MIRFFFILFALSSSVLSQFLDSIKGGPTKPFACKPLNKKPRDFFFNYHITHHGGTSMWLTADAAHLPWDGMNSNYNVELGETKADVMKKWFQSDDIEYVHMPPPDNRILPSDMKSFSKREYKSTSKVVMRLPRRYVSMEKSMKGVFRGVPLGENRINTMVIMRNPLSRMMKLVSDRITNKQQLHHLHKINNNMGIRFLAGVDLETRIITKEHYITAVNRLKMFDHVGILEDMHETIKFLCCEWKWNYCTPREPPVPRLELAGSPHLYFKNDTFYAMFLEENKYDFKLYDAAVQIAIEQLKIAGLNETALLSFPKDTLHWLWVDFNQTRTDLKHSIIHGRLRSR